MCKPILFVILSLLPFISSAQKLEESGFVDIKKLDPTILIDIKYASKDNFVHQVIYDCAACYLRKEVASQIVKINKELQLNGLKLKLFDCYRPRQYQQRLWDKKPDARFVTPPQKGSEHGKGAAVDLTIVDSNNKELDFGTPYDFFGKEAYQNYSKFPSTTLQNRKKLKNVMIKYGFKPIRTEWWHYSYQKKSFPLCSVLWECP
jgi:zinc D-Ala-D-Ala dipeptidase